MEGVKGAWETPLLFAMTVRHTDDSHSHTHIISATHRNPGIHLTLTTLGPPTIQDTQPLESVMTVLRPHSRIFVGCPGVMMETLVLPTECSPCPSLCSLPTSLLTWPCRTASPCPLFPPPLCLPQSCRPPSPAVPAACPVTRSARPVNLTAVWGGGWLGGGGGCSLKEPSEGALRPLGFSPSPG